MAHKCVHMQIAHTLTDAVAFQAVAVSVITLGFVLFGDTLPIDAGRALTTLDSFAWIS